MKMNGFFRGAFLAFSIFTIPISTFAASEGDVIIEKVYYDHSGADDGYEAVCLFNTLDVDVDLFGWELQWGGTDYTYGDYSIPNGYTIPGKSGLCIGESSTPMGPVHLVMNFNPDIQNGGTASDGIRLVDELSNVIDVVIYDCPNTNGLTDEFGSAYDCGTCAASTSDFCAPDVAEGFVLSRITLVDTNDYGADFEEGSDFGCTYVDLGELTARGFPDRVEIRWSTLSEIDNEGFHIWRSLEETEEYEPITNDIIPSEGGPAWGASYFFQDGSISPGETYLYQLEAIDIYGESAFYGPVEVKASLLCGAAAVRGEGLGLLWTIVLIVPLAFVARLAGRKVKEKRNMDREKGKETETYEPPRIKTYSGEELLDELGPAQACTGFGCPVTP